MPGQDSAPSDAEFDRRSILSRIAGDLIAAGAFDEAAWARALSVQTQTGERLDRVMTRLGLVGEAELAEALAAALALFHAPAQVFPTEPLDLQGVSLDFLRANEITPLSIQHSEVTIAVADPFDGFAPSALAAAMGLEPICAVAAATDIREHLERLYSEAAREKAAAVVDPLEDDVARLRDLASEAPVIRMVNDLIDAALAAGASDLHLEPQHDRMRVRLRVDGVLRDHRVVPITEARAVLSRVKIMARLDIAENRLPQDGRIRTSARGRELDLRVSTLPSIHGEAAVLRLLDGVGAQPSLAALGLPSAETARLREMLEHPNGVLLVTGPTGSGKTTTLYGALGDLATEAQKVLTVEDPVEYRLARTVQIQVKPEIGLGFPQTLRSLLRHDPDVIMVGEIRDRETAGIAVQAALTGHLVLSTLHTNSALGALMRLRDMGVENYLLSASILGLAAQRLLRRLCSACKQPVDASAVESLRHQAWAREALNEIEAPVEQLCEPVGCRACDGSGYRGRLPAIEVAPLTEALRGLVAADASLAELKAGARREGFSSLQANALRLAFGGETSLAEVARTVRET